MSVRCIDAVFGCRLITDPYELAVATALGDWSDDAGRSYPGTKTLARKARLSRRGLQKVLRRMEAPDEGPGYLSVSQGTGPYGTNEYRLDLPFLTAHPFPREERGSPGRPTKGGEPGTGANGGRGRTPATKGGEPGSPYTSGEPSGLNNNNNSVGQGQMSLIPDPTPSYAWDKALTQRLIGRGVNTPVASELVTQVSPDRIEKELERLRRFELLGPVDKPGGLLVKNLRGPDKPLPYWPPTADATSAQDTP